jgi:hypothetical protein
MISPDIPLPDARPDGICAACNNRQAVTRDGRFCKPCLTSLVARLSPGRTTFNHSRSPDQRQAYDRESSPWNENSVRALEGD